MVQEVDHRPRVLVVGVGGLGGTFAGWMNQHDGQVVDDVVALSRNQAVAAAVETHGFRLRGVGESVDAPGRITGELPADLPKRDFILLATQPPQVEAAARSALPWLADDGVMVVIQNGLCEERVAQIAGNDRVFGCIVGFGASHPQPGVFERTSSGGLTLGRMDGQPDPRLERLALLLEAVAPVTVSDNLAGARWSKLAINSAISTLGTLGADRLGPLMHVRVVRRLALEIMTETVRVARAQGVVLEKVAGTLDLEWLALTPEEQAQAGSASLVAKHTLLLAVGTRYRRLRSSMLYAIEAGKEPAVDFLNGEVVTRGAALGIPTPVNRRAQELVHQVAAGEVDPGVPLLRRFAGEFGFRWVGD